MMDWGPGAGYSAHCQYIIMETNPTFYGYVFGDQRTLPHATHLGYQITNNTDRVIKGIYFDILKHYI